MHLKQLVETMGYIGLFFVIFAESGLFFGFFLPGDSLLVTAGLLATQGYFKIFILIPLLIFAAIAGDSTAYWFGNKIGPRVFNKEKSIFFNKKYIESAREFYDKYGMKTIILARFLPGVRTFAPIVAGVGKMHYQRFIKYNVVGGILWPTFMLSIGYFLGKKIPNVDHYLVPIIATVVILSFIPTIFENRKHIVKHSGRFYKKLTKASK